MKKTKKKLASKKKPARSKKTKTPLVVGAGEGKPGRSKAGAIFWGGVQAVSFASVLLRSGEAFAVNIF